MSADAAGVEECQFNTTKPWQATQSRSRSRLYFHLSVQQQYPVSFWVIVRMHWQAAPVNFTYLMYAEFRYFS